MCLKSEGIQFPLRLFSFLFFPRGFHQFAFWCCFCFFSLVFVNHFFFVFFSRALCSFLLHQPLTLRLKKSLLSPWYVPSLSFRIFSLSLFSRRRGKGIRVALESALFTAGRFSRARDTRRFFLTRCGFSANFWAKKSPLSHEERVLSANVGNRARVNSRATSILSKLH